MVAKLVKGALVGGVVYFLWSFLSWMVLPWHESYMKKLPNEEPVAAAIKANVSEPGLYMTPWHEKGADQAAMQASMKAGPVGVMMLHPQGMDCSMALPLIRAFLMTCLMSLLATYLLMQTRGLSFYRRMGFVKKVGLVGSLWFIFCNWNWWGYPAMYFVVNVADQLVGWSLVGAAIAKFVVKE